MHIKAKSLENRVEKMLQEMDNVQKMMHMPTPPSPSDVASDDEYEDPSGDFDIESITTSVAIQPQQVSFFKVTSFLPDFVRCNATFLSDNN